MKILFWNTAGGSVHRLLTAIEQSEKLDVIVLAECTLAVGEVLLSLKHKNRAPFAEYIDPTLPKSRRLDRLKVFTRLGPFGTQPIGWSHQGAFALRLRPAVGADCLLVVAHLGSKLWRRDDEQTISVLRVAKLITQAEEAVGHRRTILVGDLNMNPFEAGVVAADGLHAVMTRKDALRGSRKVDREERNLFYNPMWSMLGDESRGPPGTHYFDGGGQVSYYWHTLDQVLVRPELLAVFPRNSVRVLTQVGSASLLTPEGRPNPATGSDHLPIVFSVHVERLTKHPTDGKLLGRSN